MPRGARIARWDRLPTLPRTASASTLEFATKMRGMRKRRAALDRAARRLPHRPGGRYFVRITISAYGLAGGTPPDSAVTVANPDAGTPKRAYAVPPLRE